MSEDQLLAAVVDLAGSLGIFVYHMHDSRRAAVSDPGFPDLVLAGTQGMVFAELKTAAGRVSSEQAAWRWRLVTARARWYLWRPRDLESGAIEDVLKEIA